MFYRTAAFPEGDLTSAIPVLELGEDKTWQGVKTALIPIFGSDARWSALEGEAKTPARTHAIPLLRGERWT